MGGAPFHRAGWADVANTRWGATPLHLRKCKTEEHHADALVLLALSDKLLYSLGGNWARETPHRHEPNGECSTSMPMSAASL